MENYDARLNAAIFRRCHGDRAHSMRLVVLLDPAAHMLIHQRPDLRRPGLDAGAGGFAVLQGDDEFRPLAVGDIEHPGFPGVEHGDSGVAGDGFVVARLCPVAGRVVGAMYAALRAIRWRCVWKSRRHSLEQNR